ncbi:MAG: hypothetical protein WAL30_05920 [Candidatus Aquirickettsiella sp.]
MMPYLSKIKTLKNIFLSISFATASLCTLPGYADIGPVPTPNFTELSIKNLVAGYGSEAISKKLMNMAPAGDDLTIAINTTQAAYLLSCGSQSVGPLTQQSLTQSVNLNDNENNILSFLWNPNTEINHNLEKYPLKSIDINSLLQPISYNDDTEADEAKNVINALNGSLMPINIINFNQLVANLSGNKKNNLNAKLQEKQVQAYLATLRSYLATQTVALNNLYQLYTERQKIDSSKLDPNLRPAFRALSSQTKAPISLLKLENFMATRRILDKTWYKDLIQANPATLQRQQVELLAENLSESYQTRMTLERLLATMSVLVLEFNGQVRTQLQSQMQNINDPKQISG